MDALPPSETVADLLAALSSDENTPINDRYLDALEHIDKVFREPLRAAHELLTSEQSQNLDKLILLLSRTRTLPTDCARRPCFLRSLTMALHVRGELEENRPDTARLADFDLCVSLREEILLLHTPDLPGRRIALHRLFESLFIRFELTNQFEDLERSRELLLQMLDLDSLADSRRRTDLINLSAVYQSIFEHTKLASDIDHMISVLEEAMSIKDHNVADPLDSDRFVASTLADALAMQREHCHIFATLEKEVDLRQKVLATFSDDEIGADEHLSSVEKFAHTLCERYKHCDRPSDLDTEINQLEQALEFRQALDDHNRWVSVVRLSNCFKRRFLKLEDLSDLDRACHLLNVEFQHCKDPTDPLYSLFLAEIGDAMITRFNYLGQRSDLEKAQELHELALHFRPQGHPSRARSLHDVAGAQHMYYKLTGDVEVLHSAIDAITEAVSLRPVDDSKRESSLNSMAIALLSRFQELGNTSDLHSAVELLAEAASLTSAKSDCSFATSFNMCSIRLALFEHTKNVENLNMAVELGEKAIALRPVDHPGPDRARALNSLACILHAKAQFLSRDSHDLTRSVEIHEEALQLRPPGHYERCNSLMNLANTKFTQFSISHEAIILDKVITLFEEVLPHRPQGHPERYSTLSGLGCALQARYEQSFYPTDIDQAIQLQREAVLVVPETLTGHEARVLCLRNLAGALTRRGTERNSLGDLDSAIPLIEKAIRLLPNDHIDIPHLTNTLAYVLWSRSRLFDGPERLDGINKAIELYNKTIPLLQEDSPDRSPYLGNLAYALEERYKYTGVGRDVAMKAYHSALSCSNTDDANRTSLCFEFALFYCAGSSPDITTAMAWLSKGAHFDLGIPEARLRCAMKWIELSTVSADIPQGIAAYDSALNILPIVFLLEVEPGLRLLSLQRAPMLACDAASWVLKHGADPYRAIEFLERGRSIFWTHTLQLNDPLVGLPTELAARMRKLSQQLKLLVSARTPLQAGIAGLTNMTASESYRRRRLQNDWTDALQEAQRFTGVHGTFNTPIFSETDVAKVAAEGPVIILVASVHDCYALILHSEKSPVSLRLDTTIDRLQELRHAVSSGIKRGMAHVNESHEPTPRYDKPYESPQDDNLFVDALSTLWSYVCKPILNYLEWKRTGVGSQRRLWWCPTGIFAPLPIHAAGVYGIDVSARHKECLADYAVSSTIPALKTLLIARTKADKVRSERDSVLVVAQPRAPSATWIPGTIVERDTIARIVPKDSLLYVDQALQLSVHDGSDVTRQNVLKALPAASIVHFACHGVQDSVDALSSRFLLRDDALTLSCLIHADIPKASVAFLSACQTAAVDEHQPDEAIHLGAGMMAAGFQSVIATLWSIQDNHGPFVAKEVYTALFDPTSEYAGEPRPRRVAFSLQKAVHRLRDKEVPLSSWVPFVHLGV